jgi:hypothetical protein
MACVCLHPRTFGERKVSQSVVCHARSGAVCECFTDAHTRSYTKQGGRWYLQKRHTLTHSLTHTLTLTHPQTTRHTSKHHAQSTISRALKHAKPARKVVVTNRGARPRRRHGPAALAHTSVKVTQSGQRLTNALQTHFGSPVTSYRLLERLPRL